jgi:hypothetical protein
VAAPLGLAAGSLYRISAVTAERARLVLNSKLAVCWVREVTRIRFERGTVTMEKRIERAMGMIARMARPLPDDPVPPGSSINVPSRDRALFFSEDDYELYSAKVEYIATRIYCAKYLLRLLGCVCNRS